MITFVFTSFIWWKRKTIENYWKKIYRAQIPQENILSSNDSNTSLNPHKFCRETLAFNMGVSINLTDWKVIEALLSKPFLTVEELAAEVYLSKSGVKTCLRRLYKIFDVQDGAAKKIQLIELLKQIKKQIENN